MYSCWNHIASAILLLTCAITSAAREQQGPLIPPFARQKTVQVFNSTWDTHFSVVGHKFYSCSSNTVVAYELPKLKKLWSYKLGLEEEGFDISADSSQVVLTTTDAKRPRLLCLDAVTGKWKWDLAGIGATPVTIFNGVVYAELLRSHVSAIEAKTHKVLWSKQFPASKEPLTLISDVIRLQGHDSYLLVNHDYQTFCLERKNGQEIWHSMRSDYQSPRYVFFGDGVITPSLHGTELRQLSTGKILWENPSLGTGEFAAQFKGSLASIQLGKLVFQNSQTGVQISTHPIGEDAIGGDQYLTVIGESLFAMGLGSALIENSSGKVIWSGKSQEALPHPIWTDGSNIVCFDSARLLSYIHGQPRSLPTNHAARRNLAIRMVQRYEQLDENEKKRLESLGDDSFTPLFQKFLRVCAAYDAHNSARDSFTKYEDYHALSNSLFAVTTKVRTFDLIKAIVKKKDASANVTIFSLMAEVGDPRIVTPYFIAQLEGSKTENFEMYESVSYVARNYIFSSHDPLAAKYCLKQLLNPKADPVQRNAAYWSVAGTGDDGVNAVLAERHRRKLVQPLEDRFREYVEAPKSRSVIAKKADKSGQIWGLLKCGLLGDSQDLWLAKYVQGHWCQPRFTGLSLSGASQWVKPPPPAGRFDGKTAKELAAGAWFDVLVGNEELNAGGEKGGFTNIEKARLGLRGQSIDEDGDGDADIVDPWPNVSNRASSDAERILEAAFEARYHFSYSGSTALFFAVDGMKPFEMVGRNGQTLWVPPSEKGQEWALPLEQCYENGVAFIRFAEWNSDKSKSWEDRVIRWNREHTEATVQISTYFGGLNGDAYSAVVKKAGSNWVVISMHMDYIS